MVLKVTVARVVTAVHRCLSTVDKADSQLKVAVKAVVMAANTKLGTSTVSELETASSHLCSNEHETTSSPFSRLVIAILFASFLYRRTHSSVSARSEPS